MNMITTPQTAVRSLPYAWRPDLLIIDEAHIVFDKAATPIVDAVRAQGGKVIGLTATPTREGMDRLYERILQPGSFEEMVEQGLLCKPRLFHTVQIDMAGCKTDRTGEWRDRDVERRTDAKLIGDIGDAWVRKRQDLYGGAVPTIINARTVKACENIADQLNARGFNFHVISSHEPDNLSTCLLYTSPSPRD